MHIVKTIPALRCLLDPIRAAQKTIGFVPTMGALHDGHASLIRTAQQENDYCVVSIFVNPTQFDDTQDLSLYPRTLKRDSDLLRSLKADCLFIPDYQTLYPDQYRFRIQKLETLKDRENEARPGHFDGVLTVVMKLLTAVQATRAYFGEKDYQQYELIKEMCAAFFVDTSIECCPTVREKNGLAMSSRNLRLTDQGREKAGQIYQILSTAKTVTMARSQLTEAGFHVDYVTENNGRRYVAVFYQDIRLIDNCPI